VSRRSPNVVVKVAWKHKKAKPGNNIAFLPSVGAITKGSLLVLAMVSVIVHLGLADAIGGTELKGRRHGRMDGQRWKWSLHETG
jgi:hypothetical protein